MSRTAVVSIRAPGLRMPRMDIQRCSASSSTTTISGCKALYMASATSAVSRSCTCGLGRGHLQSAAQLAYPGDPVSGHIADPGLSEKGQQVVLAHRIEGQMAHRHRVVGYGLENCVNSVFRARAHASEEGLVHPGHPGRRMLQAFPARVFADGFQDVGHRLLYPALLDRDLPSP